MKRKNIIGLIGYPLSHSFSQSYFSDKFKKEGIKDYEYLNFEIDSIEKIREIIISYPDLKGLNVTIPYKSAVIPYLDQLSDDARDIGAVNTIVVERISGKFKTTGYNTDYIGFDKTLDLILSDKPAGALILGTGGASKAVEFSLKKMNIPFRHVSRNPEGKMPSYRDINRNTLSEFPLLINTTPLGMHPDVEGKPEIPYALLNQDNYLIDLIYNPDKTAFLQLGEQAGAKTINGLPMLIEQAEAAWNIWQS